MVDRLKSPPRSPDVAAQPWPSSGPGSMRPLGEAGEAGQAAARRAVYALPPPTEAPAPGASYFRVQGRNAAQLAAAGEVVLDAFQLPTGQLGAIRIVEFDINGILISSNIIFRIRVDGLIPPGWQWSPFPTGAAFFAKEFPPESTYIRVSETALIQVTAEVIDAGTYDLGADLQGWHYGAELRDGYEAAWAAVLY